MLVYDPTRSYTFEACRSWFQRIHEVLQPPHSMVRTRRSGGRAERRQSCPRLRLEARGSRLEAPSRLAPEYRGPLSSTAQLRPRLPPWSLSKAPPQVLGSLPLTV